MVLSTFALESCYIFKVVVFVFKLYLTNIFHIWNSPSSKKKEKKMAQYFSKVSRKV